MISRSVVNASVVLSLLWLAGPVQAAFGVGARPAGTRIRARNVDNVELNVPSSRHAVKYS